MQYIITLDKTVGIYGHDADGNPWTTWGGPTKMCAECGWAINSGWERGMMGDETHYCSKHVKLQAEEDESVPGGDNSQSWYDYKNEQEDNRKTKANKPVNTI